MSQASPRLKKQPTYKSFAFQKSLRKKSLKLKTSGQLLLESWVFLKTHWLIFAKWIVLVFVIGFILFWHSGLSSNLQEKQETWREISHGWVAEIEITWRLLPELVSDFLEQLSQNLGWFIVLMLVSSLALFWLMRQLKAGVQNFKIRDSFYFGSAQIISFCLVGLALFLQFLPSLIVLDAVNGLREGGVLLSNLEQLGALAVVVFVFGFSFYWVLGGVFSLIIVSLSGVRPLQAWQTSLDLTRRSRQALIPRVLFLIVLSLLALILLNLPFLWLIPQWADYFFYFNNILIFIFAHIYSFLLYEDLLLNQDKIKVDD